MQDIGCIKKKLKDFTHCLHFTLNDLLIDQKERIKENFRVFLIVNLFNEASELSGYPLSSIAQYKLKFCPVPAGCGRRILSVT